MIKLYLNTIEKYGVKNPFNILIGFSRSVLAFGTLLTLIFNSQKVIFPKYNYENLDPFFILNKINFFFIFGNENIVIAKIIAILLLFFVIIGYFPKFIGIIHFWIVYSFLTISPIVDGGDSITSNLVFLLMFLSFFDERRNHWDTQTKHKEFSFKNIIGNGILFLIALQMAVIYLHAGLGKLVVAEWRSGTGFYYYFNLYVYGGGWLKNILNPLFSINYIIALISWGTIFFELYMFSVIFIKNVVIRKFAFKIAITFHILIIVVHGLPSFFLAMLGGLCLYLLEENDILKLKNELNVIYRKAKIK